MIQFDKHVFQMGWFNRKTSIVIWPDDVFEASLTDILATLLEGAHDRGTNFPHACGCGHRPEDFS